MALPLRMHPGELSNFRMRRSTAGKKMVRRFATRRRRRPSLTTHTCLTLPCHGSRLHFHHGHHSPVLASASFTGTRNRTRWVNVRIVFCEIKEVSAPVVSAAHVGINRGRCAGFDVCRLCSSLPFTSTLKLVHRRMLSGCTREWRTSTVRTAYNMRTAQG